METVGFIGLGNMGGPVAGHIHRAGFPLVVFDLRDQASRPFRERGARVANSAAELARRSDVIVTALPMPDDVEQVVRGAKGILEGIRANRSISIFRPIRRRLSGASNRSLRQGRVRPRRPGCLRPAGRRPRHPRDHGRRRQRNFRARRTGTRAFGDQVLHAGPLGSGCICKLVHQMINSTISQAIAEGLTLGVKAGVETKSLWEAVRRGMVGRMHVLHAQVPQTVFRDDLRQRCVPAQTAAQRCRPCHRARARARGPLAAGEHRGTKTRRRRRSRLGRKSAYTVAFRLQEEAANVELRADVDPAAAAKYISTHPDST